MRKKCLIIVGPTASGKSDLAVELALLFGGEVISADSRQVYRGMDVGTGKITASEMKGVPHHCLDIADPRERFTIADWKRCADEAMAGIIARGKLPIICGGTGFYIDALVDDIDYPKADIDDEKQAELEQRPADELYKELQRLDPAYAAIMQKTSNYRNSRRVARAILIARELGSVPPIGPKDAASRDPDIEYIWIGILPYDAIIRERIRARLIKRLDSGMIDEARHLHDGGLSYGRMEELGLEYRYLARFLQGQLAHDELINELSTKIWQYARRQKTWWKRNPLIDWFSSGQPASPGFGAIVSSVRQRLSQDP